MNNSMGIALGSPRFANPELAAIEASGDVSSAWQSALKGTASAAAADAQGHFAAVTRTENGRTVLAVDRFSTQSLCYRTEGAALLFSERATALAGDGAELDPQALFNYLYFHAIPSPRTIYRGVARLPPGHCAWSDGASTQVERYWLPSFHETATDFGHARERFRSLLEQAVASQLDDGTPACFLSGGTDSSTIAGMIGKVAGRPAHSYSIGFEAEGYDEMAYARLASKHFGTVHHEYYVTPADLVRCIPLMAAHLDQPFGNSSVLPAYLCALRARDDGVTRLLAGDGGDELFGGNTRYATQRVLSWYEALPTGVRASLIEPAVDTGAFDAIPLLKKGASYSRQARVSMPERMQSYNLLQRLGVTEVLTPEFLTSVETSEPAKHQQSVWAESEGASLVNRMLAYDWRYTLAEIDLPKVRYATQLAGLSVDYPFLDQAVVDFSTRLPTSFKLRGLKLRWFFKEALRGFLPEAIITKKKHGFGLPFGVWATRDDALRSMAHDSVRALGHRGLIHAGFADTLVKHRLPEHPGYYGEMVWILTMLEQWLRQHAPNYRVGR
jgi:asparagine synthase (glutamine-hydrolysing)